MTKHVLAFALLVAGAAAISVPASGAEAVMPAPGCTDCDTPRHYDSEKVVKTTHDVDHSKVINTTSYAPAQPAYIDGGNSIRVRSDVTLVNFVVHRYRIIEAPALVPEGSDYRPAQSDYRPTRTHYRPKPSCKYGSRNRYDGCGPVRVRG